MTRLVCAFVIAVLLCCTSCGRTDRRPQVLTTVYGRKLTGAVSFEQDLFRVTGSETAWAVKAKAVQDVRFSQLRKMPDSKMQAIVSTRYGSIFACSLLAKREPEHLTCSTAEFGTVSLGFQHLRAIRFHGEDVWISPGSFASELEQLPAQRLDLLKLSNGDTYKCIVLSLSNDGVTVETGGRELKFARSALDTIVFAESDRRNSSMYALVNSVYANSYALMLRSLDGKSLVGELVFARSSNLNRRTSHG
ncbi:MAG: hypothetical protein U5N86_02990 [Planctomycetota bacterium]|nr:hypothetical protein [Planctomycetota bacterium]